MIVTGKKMSKSEEIAKRNVRDSIFTQLFRDKNNVLELYQTLHPEDIETDTSDIEIVTIEMVLVDGLYNDLGFSVKGKRGCIERIILVESQTKWDKNMAERMSAYAQKTREKYWKDSKQRYHQQAKMNTPVFEHYVIYTGQDNCNEEYIMLHDCCVPKYSMNLGIKVITEVSYTICGQYIGFCKLYTNNLRKYKGNRNKILEVTIEECFEKGYLKDFLKYNLWEVKDSMGMFYDQACAIDDYGEEREEKGREIGEKIGREEGEKIGRQEGEKIGREEGEKIGREAGIEEAIKAFFAKDRKKMELIAKSMGMSMKEYVTICAENMKIDKEIFVKLCAKNIGMTVKEYKDEYGIE